jgi:hypothetical protein
LRLTDSVRRLYCGGVPPKRGIMENDIRNTILEAIEAALEAQLGAVRKLRKAEAQAASPKRSRGLSQMDMAYDVLRDAGGPLHLNEIVSRVSAKFAIKADPDSLGSALTKKVVKKQRFARTGKSTFAILEGGDAR